MAAWIKALSRVEFVVILLLCFIVDSCVVARYTGGYTGGSNSGKQEPRICENTKDKDANGTVLGKFICPKPSQASDQKFCCGSEGAEDCCGFWDSPGRLAGAVVGIIIGVVGITVGIISIVWCCKKCKAAKRKTEAAEDATNSNQSHTGNGSVAPYPVYPSSFPEQSYSNPALSPAYGMAFDQKAYPPLQ